MNQEKLLKQKNLIKISVFLPGRGNGPEKGMEMIFSDKDLTEDDFAIARKMVEIVGEYMEGITPIHYLALIYPKMSVMRASRIIEYAYVCYLESKYAD